MTHAVWMFLSQGAEVTSATFSHSPQTVAAAVLCYALMSLFH